MRRWLSLLLTVLLLLAGPGWARLGGGQSYSSGRSSSSSSSSYHSYSGGSSSSSSYHSSSSSGGGQAGFGTLVMSLLFLFFLLLVWGGPVLGFFVLGKKLRGSGAVELLLALARASNQNPGGSARAVASSGVPARLKASDKNFSEPAFRAFASLLFSRLHHARGQDLGMLRAYFSESVLAQVGGTPEACDVVVGACHFLNAEGGPPGWEFFRLELEATYRQAEEEFYTVERWIFGRHLGQLSKDPDTLLGLGCPNCGNSGELSPQGVCPYCQQVVDNGAFGWKVVRRSVETKIPKPPIALEPGQAEAGTEAATLYPADFDASRRAFLARRADFDWEAFQERAGNIFLRLQEAWSDQDFSKARPFETDTIYDTHRFWIERYRAQGLKNHLRDVQVEKIQACRYDHDAFYDLITVRIFASMKDYTTDRANVVVAGSPHQSRRFSEYWTFLRRIGGKAGPVKGDLSSCPNCGAALSVSQAGVCEYCQAKVTSGEYDWILSSIEQDESYSP
jgi:hypothetical protein